MALQSLSLLLVVAFTQTIIAAPGHLNITAISAANGTSHLECWQLSEPLVTSGQAGTSGAAIAQLGVAGNVSYSILPPHFNGGLHNAPVAQYVAFVSGRAVITLPNSTETAVVYGGKDGLIFAADTAAVSKFGHITNYPGNRETIGIQIPTANGTIPGHIVLHQGPCVEVGRDRWE